MAMFTKETAIIMPMAIFLYDICFLKTERALLWKRLAPFFAAMAIIPITMFATKSVDFLQMRRITEGPPGISSFHYLLTQFNVIITYIRLLVIPLNQNIDYDYHIAKSLTEPSVLISLALLVFILAAAVKLFPKYRMASFGIFFFFLTLLPESSIVPIADVIFEHRLYLPVAGYAVFLASIVYYLFGWKNMKALGIAMSIMIVFYSALAYNRNFAWKDDLSLWSDAVRKSPDKARPYNNRGYAYLKKGEADLALRDLDKAISLDPVSDAGYYYNRGNAYIIKGMLDNAIANYTRAILMKPRYAEAYVNRAIAYFKKRDYDKSRMDVRAAQALGYGVSQNLLENLRRAAGSQR